MIGIRHVRMTVLTLNLFDAAMYIMTEWDRLFRTDSLCRWSKEKIDKCTREDQGEKR